MPVLVTAAAAASLVGATPAAGPDCARAASAVDRAACTDPAARKADAAMIAACRQALGRLSAEGGARLSDSQRSFLAFRAAECGADDKVAACVARETKNRASELAGSVRRLAGRTFIATTIYRVHRPAPGWRYAAGVADNLFVGRLPGETVTLLQIDRPAGEAERRWNVAMRAEADELLGTAYADLEDTNGRYDPNEPKDVLATIHFVSAGPGVIVTRGEAWFYVSGMAHGRGGDAVVARSLALGRPLEADELFDRARNW